MSELTSLKGELLATRAIEVNTYKSSGGGVVVEGTLKDRRHVSIYAVKGDLMDPGPVHEMVARFLIEGTPPKIVKTETVFEHFPMDECPRAFESFDQLAGLPLTYGFSKEVKKRLGGTKGCVHLTSLALAMGAAALQGWSVGNRLEPMPPQVGAFTLEYIKDSCMVWRADGEHFQRARARIVDE